MFPKGLDVAMSRHILTATYEVYEIAIPILPWKPWNTFPALVCVCAVARTCHCTSKRGPSPSKGALTAVAWLRWRS